MRTSDAYQKRGDQLEDGGGCRGMFLIFGFNDYVKRT